jgi:hypothetical protein
MSIDAMKWAMDQEIFPSAAKFILICLCDYAGKKSDLAYPSIETLCKKTSQDRKTVISGLDKLCELGFLEEAGAFPGGVKHYRVVGLPDEDNHYVYRVSNKETGEFYIGARSHDGDVYSDRFLGGSRWIQEKGNVSFSKEIIGVYTTRKEAELAEAFFIYENKGSDSLKNRFPPREKDVPKTAPVPKTGPVPKTVQVVSQKRDGGSTENGTGVVPKTVHRTINEPVLKPLTNLETLPTKQPKLEKKEARALPDWIQKESWDGFVAMRKTIRKPLTDHAIDLTIAKLEKMLSEGEDVNAVLDQSTMNSWQGLVPMKNGNRGNASRPEKFDGLAYVMKNKNEPEIRNEKCIN